MTGQKILDRIIHLFIHPFGKVLRMLNPRFYELIRWQIAQVKWMKPIMGSPMYHQLILPFAVRKGDTVFDIGANHGQLVLPLAGLVGKNGKVHAFEPISDNFRELQKNIMKEDLSARIVLNQLALGDETKSINFTIPRERPTEATSVPHNAMDWSDYGSDPWKYTTETCKMTTLDNYIKDNHINKISFIKCDVEGAELFVLKGARNLLRGVGPPVIMLEVFDGWMKDFGYTPRDLFKFLQTEAGYEFYWICEAGLKRVDPNDDAIPGIYYQWLDYLCIVPNVHSNRVNVKRYLV